MSAPGAKRAHEPRSLAIFGGTFDPIHAGHLAVAEAAERRFRLDAIHFMPSSRPPHKSRQELASFTHRYAMVALACAGHARFFASLAEAPPSSAAHVFYSIDTVRRFRRENPHDRLHFILGADSFLELPTWRSYEALLDSCDFVIASRPGFRLDALRLVIPPEMLGRTASRDPNTIALRKSAIHLLTAVASHISSTEIRRRCMRKQSIHALVPAGVEDYIHKQALYR
ncbi:MAG TPA: nicotinate-nucleotide adenylyltransferase [Candidatus Acidoferrales bacterium]|nr:nicotinate-nucleotide adenylyltransferase [Candidatus Acidoferrales bacterium]